VGYTAWGKAWVWVAMAGESFLNTSGLYSRPSQLFISKSRKGHVSYVLRTYLVLLSL
jgi:hypothetical protein